MCDSHPRTAAGIRLIAKVRHQQQRALDVAAELHARQAEREHAETVSRIEAADPETLHLADKLFLAAHRINEAVEVNPLLRAIRDRDAAWRARADA